jgi:hypothetical protein
MACNVIVWFSYPILPSGTKCMAALPRMGAISKVCKCVYKASKQPTIISMQCNLVVTDSSMYEATS